MVILSDTSINDLVPVGSYNNHEDANTLREFLLNRGVTGVLVIERTADLNITETSHRDLELYEIMVPAIEAPKALQLLESEFRMR